MGWPTPNDFDEAADNLRHAMGDEELRQGQAARDDQQLPLVWAGNFANVYRIDCAATGKSWALKCFTREVAARQERYRQIAHCLQAANLPFTAPFAYLERGIQVRGQWYPAVKMEWVEGQTLNRFVEESLDKPGRLRQLLDLWPKLAARLREAGIAHADLQHGNVLLVPAADGMLALKLIDYDGLFVPSLAGTPSGEAGHPNYQHPARLAQGVYNAHVDRFSHLVIFAAVHCLWSGQGDLWRRFNNDENLLFREQDFQQPQRSELLQHLWALDNPGIRGLAGRLALAAKRPLEETPWLDHFVHEGQVPPLTAAEEHAAAAILSRAGAAARTPAPGEATAAEDNFSIRTDEDQMTPAATRPVAGQGTVAILPPPLVLPAKRKSFREGLAAATRGLGEFLRRFAGQHARLLRNLLLATVGVLLLATVWAALRPRTPPPGPDASPAAPPAIAAGRDLKPQIEIDLGGGEKLELVLIPAGEFLMGSPDGDDTAEPDEKPQHRVRITRPFYLGKYKVTQGQWQAVLGKQVNTEKPAGPDTPAGTEKPPSAKGRRAPVQNVSWADCRQFLEKVNARIAASGFQLVLPSEAEWEYACRAGSTTRYCFGDRESALEEYAWYGGKSGDKPHSVGSKKPNLWGLFDMHGDGQEWCADWYDGNYYTHSPADDPAGPATGTERVARGGNWDAPADRCRSAVRVARRPTAHVAGLGFRVAEVFGDAPAAPQVAAAPQSVPPPSPPASIEPKVEEAKPVEKTVTAKAEPAVKPPPELSFDLGRGVKLEMELIPAGAFLMGSPAADGRANSDEKPQHRVQITKPFYLGKYLVTQEQWEAEFRGNPSRNKGPKNPVEQVGWDDCQQFITKLNLKFGTRSGKFRLPSEAEWEYACRAGSDAAFSFGGDDSVLGDYAWYKEDAGGKTHAVGTKKPNAWGLYDMHGNVWQWSADWYGENYYAVSPLDDPKGPASGTSRVLRGGSWGCDANDCRSARRLYWSDLQCDFIGFRVARELTAAAPAEVAAPTAPSEPRAVQAATAAPPNPSKDNSVQLGDNSVQLGHGVMMQMVYIPAGEYQMGSPDSDKDADADEKPQHVVRINKPFYLGCYEVTQRQWQEVMGGNPSCFPGPNNPVEQISWEDCQQFLKKLNARFPRPRSGAGRAMHWEFRVPTEAQWEYACRAGSTTKYYYGDDPSLLGDYAWYEKNSGQRTHAVGEKKPNAWGLYDMHGNVCEWCSDWYDAHYYATSPADDPPGPAGGKIRLDRGGSWLRPAEGCRSAERIDVPGERYNGLGLRVARVQVEE